MNASIGLPKTVTGEAKAAASSQGDNRRLALTYRRVADLTPNARNPRLHPRKQIRQIAASIGAFGFNVPILIDAADRVVAGHARLLAARELGMTEVPTVRLEHLTEAEARAFMVADNRLAEHATWDQALLAETFRELQIQNFAFDIEVTGFEIAEIDILVQGEPAPEPDARANTVPAIDASAPAISRAGDLWILGTHRLYCGDARDPAAYAALMDGKRARMAFSDPPFNVPIKGHVSGLGAVQHREFAMASGEMSRPEFVAFLDRVIASMVAHSADGALHYLCMDWRHLHELLGAGHGHYSELKNLCVWNKTNGGMGSLYRSKHELVTVWKVGTAAHLNNVELGRHGRYRSNVWDYPGVNTFRAGRAEELAMHPTVKPMELVADAILDVSRRGDIVLDPFAGSGTTVVAAERTGRCAFVMEIDPLYADTIVRRWQMFAGETVTHGETGESFADTADRRREAGAPASPL